MHKYVTMKKAEDLNLEEIFHESRGQQRSLEMSLTRSVFYGFYAFFIILVFIFSFRIFILAGYNGKFYSKRALANVNKEVYIPAPRGIIYDRNNIILADNKPSFSVSIKLSEFRKNQAEITTFLKDKINISEAEILSTIKNSKLEESDLVIISNTINEDELIKLKAVDIKGLYIEDNYLRNYPHKDSFSHVVGYVDTENIGRTGLESFYETNLDGTDGALVKQYNAKGDLLDSRELRKSIPGIDLATTIDAELQIYLKNQLLERIRILGRSGGVGVAINPKNGEVLALVSAPTFDANLFSTNSTKETSSIRKEILQSKARPLFDRAISGIYNPGSTIKPLVAVAALSENIITTQKTIHSKGFVEIPNIYNPELPSRFLDWKPNGWVDLYSALAKSSNIYFYAVGGGFPSGGGAEVGADKMVGLGIDRLIKWWKIFGFGEKTGIDLNGENKGFLPNPTEKELRTGTPWRIGDTYNVSIGQGDLLISPLQLVNYIGAIANNGKLYELHLNKLLEPKLIRTIDAEENQINEVRKGMRDVVKMPYGTAHSLNTLPFDVAAKTGTAQVQNNFKTNAFTVAFAPYDNPEIAIIILIEDARDGSVNSIPVAHNVLEWYYWNRIVKQPKLSVSNPLSSTSTVPTSTIE